MNVVHVSFQDGPPIHIFGGGDAPHSAPDALDNIFSLGLNVDRYGRVQGQFWH